ncbi:DUF6011 domain-containing protein [Kitasatospora viridis]|uniref:Uncharacterized protein n=1 Tax=Kitasatospora viridis TaxID=281105 RepID=A0A561S9X1_9ACTN|nr:DUF6011 domain-containing protein [Kitasatospora viridis]TWF71672.1 hypothetical protein FHX73_1843 [Kitasatospora viridis]
MAHFISGPLRVLGIENGRPVFSYETPRTAPLPAPEAPKTASKPVREAANAYPGTCTVCGTTVAAGAGLREKTGTAWTVRHRTDDNGRCLTTASAEPKAAAPVKKTATPASSASSPKSGPVRLPSGTVLLPGYFTVEGVDGGGHVTLRVRRQKAGEKFMPGRFLVAYLSGPENTADYTNFANADEADKTLFVWKAHQGSTRLRQALAALAGDQITAGKAWARASQCCWRCGLPLTTPESLDRLIGPECATKI